MTAACAQEGGGNHFGVMKTSNFFSSLKDNFGRFDIRPEVIEAIEDHYGCGYEDPDFHGPSQCCICGGGCGPGGLGPCCTHHSDCPSDLPLCVAGGYCSSNCTDASPQEAPRKEKKTNNLRKQSKQNKPR